MPGYGLIDGMAALPHWQALPMAILIFAFKEQSDMPTRNISLTPEQDAFVQKVVDAGEYQNASEAVRDALRALQQRRREDALRLKVLRMQIAAGADELERGDFVEVDAQDLEAYLDGLTAGAAADSR
jgi:antitoxin ParD1/3/4